MAKGRVTFFAQGYTISGSLPGVTLHNPKGYSPKLRRAPRGTPYFPVMASKGLPSSLPAYFTTPVTVSMI